LSLSFFFVPESLDHYKLRILIVASFFLHMHYGMAVMSLSFLL
jgi:hypothetical protein